MASHSEPPKPAPSNAPNLPHRSSVYANRRPPAHRSVSLLHSSSRSNKASSLFEQEAQKSSSAASRTAQAGGDALVNPTSPVGRPKHNQHSSGESSDAGNWFANSNDNIRQTNKFGPDNDPPFFLRNPSSSSTPPDQVAANAYQNTAFPTRPSNPPFMHMPTDGSSGDDYRSVIDDLTIANKKLRRKLRRYEKMHDAHLQDEKLFEVRFHGLPDHKKRELEETLRKFALSVEAPPGTSEVVAPISSGFGAEQTYPSSLLPQKTNTSSHTSRFAESGYASMSMSGQENSSVPSGPEGTPRNHVKPAFNMQHADIRSYLHDIPIGLLPRGNTMAMTERSKKKLVVRRLEQIFAGKGPVLDRQQQPIQQQEVSNSAARADRRELEATGQRWRKEGMRIAKIMPHSDGTGADTGSAAPSSRPGANLALQDSVGNDSPDQRPTRPLDLDPHRAQVPADNIEYMRHLGFTPPDMERSPEEGHGWVYLNLLINMAQLHTVNVTLDFVQKAVGECSSHLELSQDGRKVRWKGGSKLTRTNSDSSSECDGDVSPESTYDGINHKRSEVSHSASDQSKSRKRHRDLAAFEYAKPLNKHVYTPLFTHKEDTTDDFSFSPTDPSTLSQPGPGYDSSGFASSDVRGHPTKRRREDGPIIFYTRAKFCTDLSGDQNRPEAPSTYEKMTKKPLGDNTGASPTLGSCSERRDTNIPFPHMTDIEMQDASTGSSSPSDLNVSLKSLETNLDAAPNAPRNHNFEVSGVGGIQPEDNFAIHVISRHVSNSKSWPKKTDLIRSKKRNYLPPKLRSIFSSRKHNGPSDVTIHDEIISATTHHLPASTLPPASFLTLHSSSGDADSDDESDVESEDFSMTSTQHQPTVRRQPVTNIPFDYGISEESETSEDEDEDEGDQNSLSVDLLATARQIDPETIRLQEREYESNVAERLAEEIPAGSSAATAGGGSGFNSPADTALKAAARA